ncbi:hypothetical protein CK203_009005 [Vitis vinifera]|uniref:Uncharacterized protein n=1 Tax=Vitis vinifera TaxID=29760 RepID=A0A438K2Q7_VITVI|nr:hypothetical protein CK203_009005 [Vitis vinifera]
MPTEKGEENVILFTKEQFNAGLRFPLPALFKEFLHFSQIPPISFIPTLSGLPDSTKGGAKGLVAVGVDGRGYRASVEAFFSKLYLKNSGFGIEGPPCGLGGKGVLCLKLKRLTLKRRKLLEDRDQKKLKALSGRLPDRSGVRTPPKKTSGKRGSWPSLAAARLANVAEEAASINRPGNLNPDADAAETAPLEEAGAESQSQPSDDPDRWP